MQQAVGVLLDTYPILRHSVLNPHGNEPFYQFDETIQCGDIVRVRPLSPSVDRTELIRQANLNGMTFDVTSGPMIQCQLHQSITPDCRDSLVLLFDHVLCDGLGGRNLFSDLLSLLSAQTLPPAPNGLPLLLDDTVDCTPAVTRARIVSNYPPLMPTYDARSGEQLLTDFALSANTLQNLLTVMKRHGVSTLHPVLHTASLVALHLATGLIDPCVVLTSTPISERDERKGHPRSTGNYVVFHYATTEIASSMSFWDEARRFSASLREPSTRINARSTLGAVGQAASREAHESGTEGWGAYIDGLISKSNGTGRLGVAVSNVGKLDLPSGGKLAEQVRDVYFAQSSSAVGAAIVLSVGFLIIANVLGPGQRGTAHITDYQLHFGTISDIGLQQRWVTSAWGPCCFQCVARKDFG